MLRPMRIHVSSLGCKLNQAEMDDLIGRLAAAGHQIVASAVEADLCVLNTCAVTHVAAQKSRQALRRLNRENPDARLVVTGCYAELARGELEGFPGVETVAGNRAKEQLAAILGGLASGEPCAPEFRRYSFRSSQTHTRALLKIQDGCDNSCTYCIVRVARGPQRSRTVDEVLEDVRGRLDAGYQEIVLTGVHIGAYGRDRQGGHGGTDLWGLVRRILAETPVPRLRLSSIEPWDLPEQALELWQDRRLCRHLHLPLQSGCEATLHRMARRYTAAEFAALVAAARQAIPDLAVTTDVMVGFPGETEQEFAESLSFVETMELARTHVFPFSPRPGTPAAAMAGQVPPGVREERARAMRSVGAAGEKAFRQQFLGRTLQVLWETARPGPDGRVWSGLTDNYLRVHTTSEADLHNKLTQTRLVALVEGGLRGEL